MKKILIILTACLIISGCSEAGETIITPVPTSTVDVSAIPTVEPVVTINFLESIDNNFIAGSSFNTIGDGNLIYDLNKLTIETKANSSYTVYQDSIYLKSGSHTLSFIVNSENIIDFYLRIYDDNNNIISEVIICENGKQVIDIDLSSIIYNLKIEIFVPELESSNIVNLENLKIEQAEPIQNIKINQVGYLENSAKEAVFSNINGNYFEIKDAHTKDVVATYALSNVTDAKYTNERLQLGDFSTFTKPGEYYLESQFGYVSSTFIIENTAYDNLLIDTLDFFYVQRCSHEISEEEYPGLAHDICHINLAKVQTTGELIDTSGGWHDAGDYGKYIETGAKALSDMLIATLINPELTNDTNILEEMKYELDWMIKMQREDGAVYSRVGSEQFPGYIMPEEDESLQYVLQVSTASSANFAAVMSLGSEVYKEYNPEYAQLLLDAALKAYKYVSNTSEYNPGVPSGFSIGNYIIGNDSYYRFYMGISLWYATNDEVYLDYAFSVIDLDNYSIYDTYWNPLLLYPSYLYLEKAESKDAYYSTIQAKFYDYINSIVTNSNKNLYNITLTDNYTWGSNHNIIDSAMALLMQHDLTQSDDYLNLAASHLDYILGKNPLSFSFITGYGESYPENIHHRVTIVNDSDIVGAMVGGANASGSDNVIVEKYQGTNTPDAYQYVDDINSYSTNEVAIHYNSSLLFVLSYLKYN